MNLIEFYTKVIESADFKIVKDVVYVDDDTVLKVSGVPLALPTNNIIQTMNNADGTVNYNLFNPLLEDIYTRKDANQALARLLFMAKIKLSFSLAELSKLLLASTELKQTSMDVTNFITELNKEVNNPAIKKIVDDTNTTNIHKILFESIGKENEPIKIVQNKNSKISKDKFGMVTTLYSPLLDWIYEKEKLGKVEEINGVKTRPKDVAILKTILKYMLLLSEDNVRRVGSNTTYPGLDGYLQLYLTVAEWFNTIAEDLKGLSLELYEGAYIPLKITADEYSKLDMEKLKLEASLYPKEYNPTVTGVKDNIPSPTATSARASLLDKFNSKWDSAEQPVIAQHNSYLNTTPTVKPLEVPATKAMSEYDKAMMLLSGKTITEPIYVDVPDVRNYHGPRADLHVSHIYNSAPAYVNPYLVNNNTAPVQNNPVGHYNGATMESKVYVPLSQRLKSTKMEVNPYLV